MAGPGLLKLDPLKANQLISTVAAQQSKFLTAINSFGTSLLNLQNNSINDQIANATILGSKLQAALGNFVANSMSRYFDKLVSVFESWRKSDFPTAQPIMYMCFAFQPVQIMGACYVKTEVSLNLIKSTANDLKTQLDNMLACFDEIDRQVRASDQWWTGDGADKSRKTWIDKYYLRRELIRREVTGFITMLRGVGDDLAYRDAGTANSSEDRLEWYPSICETVYGELNTQLQVLRSKQAILEDKPERSILGMVGVSADYLAVIEAVRKTNQGMDRWLLVQEPYRGRIKAPYAPLSMPDPEADPLPNAGSGPENLLMVQIKDPYRVNFKPALDPGVTGDDITDPLGIQAEDLLAQMPPGLSIEVYLALMTATLGDSAADLRAQADDKQRQLDAIVADLDRAGRITATPLEWNQDYMNALNQNDTARMQQILDEYDWAYRIQREEAPGTQTWQNLVDAEYELRDQANKLEEMASSLQNLLATAIPGAPPLPLNGIIIPDDENQPPMALTLYLKPFMEDGRVKWQVLDVTRPYATRTYNGDTAADAMRNYIENNDLPAGRVAISNPNPPLEYGVDIGILPTRTELNQQSDGKNDWKSFKEGAQTVGWLALIGAGLLGLIGLIPGLEPVWAGIPFLLGGSGLAFAAGSVANIGDRVTYGHFAWDFETFMDIIQIGLAPLDAVAVFRGAGQIYRVATTVQDGVAITTITDESGKIIGRMIMDESLAGEFNQLSQELQALRASNAGETQIAAKLQEIENLQRLALSEGRMVYQGVSWRVRNQIAELQAAGVTNDALAAAVRNGYNPADLKLLVDSGMDGVSLSNAITAGYKPADLLDLINTRGLSGETVSKIVANGANLGDVTTALDAGLSSRALSVVLDSGHSLSDINNVIGTKVSPENLSLALEEARPGQADAIINFLNNQVATGENITLVDIHNIRYSQGDVSPNFSDGTPISEIADIMRQTGWDYSRELPQMVQYPDGRIVSLDHRRMVAADQAGINVTPAQVHPSTEAIPAELARRRFSLLVDFTDPATGQVYRAGDYPANWGEAAMFRSANQRVKGFPDFPIEGSTNLPIIRPPRTTPRTGPR